VPWGLINRLKEINGNNGAIYFTDHVGISPSGIQGSGLVTGSKSLCHELSQEVSSPDNRFQRLDSKIIELALDVIDG
jgi:hypothetical protein